MTTAFAPVQLEIIRRAFAGQMMSRANVQNAILEKALSEVPRELFMPDGPWKMANGSEVHVLPENNPAHLYQDALFVLDEDRGINNGSPALHVKLLNSLAPRAGDHVAHFGIGAGYYSAILATIVGPDGRVVAVENDPTLAKMAQNNLRPWSNVTVICADAADYPREQVDRIYVNFSVERPCLLWLEQLAPFGRLVFPLGFYQPSSLPDVIVRPRHGAAFVVTREPIGFGAQWITAAYFVSGAGKVGEPAIDRAAVQKAFETGGQRLVRSLRLGSSVSARDWLLGEGWSLSHDPP